MAKPERSSQAMARGYNKTSTVTVRLSPKHRYALDLMARMSRQTVSAVIESLIRKEAGPALTAINAGPSRSMKAEKLDRALVADHAEQMGEVLRITWDPREPDRFINIALYAHGLLTEDEELVWQLIRETAEFWRGDEPRREVLRANWTAILRAAEKGVPSLRNLTFKE